ncbi:hypothetical protein, partial [Nonomuraea lactucae]|uniref:hypothetical protein n=1 Tax=Nonomuraea lactucae TaxID=2249762 RepID=UPI00196505C5
GPRPGDGRHSGNGRTGEPTLAATPAANGALTGFAVLSPAEREQIEDAAEEDRHWLAVRAVTAKRALVAAAGQDADPALTTFPDLADPGPWRPQDDTWQADDGPWRGDDGPGLGTPHWQVVHLPLHTSQGEALGAVAVPHDRVRLRFDTLTEQAR